MKRILIAVSAFIGIVGLNVSFAADEKMQQMCSMFNDEKFMVLGFAFHKSGDDLGDALKTRDVATSLRALNKTMEYCVSCHAAYRQ